MIVVHVHGRRPLRVMRPDGGKATQRARRKGCRQPHGARTDVLCKGTKAKAHLVIGCEHSAIVVAVAVTTAGANETAVLHVKEQPLDVR